MQARTRNVSDIPDSAQGKSDAEGTGEATTSKSANAMKRSASVDASEVSEEKRQKLMDDHMTAGDASATQPAGDMQD